MKFDNNIIKYHIKIKYDDINITIISAKSNDSGIIRVFCYEKTNAKEYYIRIDEYNDTKMKLRNEKLKSL
ncbi:hypothetical protein M0Q50_10445 [bacterium]|jgi:hypothetical protein|nr:hypothetical protein [bacterium]